MKTPAPDDNPLFLDRGAFIQLLADAQSQPDVESLRRRLTEVKDLVRNAASSGIERLVAASPNGNAVSLRRDVLISELDQILQARTIERARYYLRRLEKGISQVRTGKINDINLHRWKEYAEIITDSLWVLPKRDVSGAHLGWYWGNFVPQIPHQLMLRYTKRGDWVLDPFLGSGTTLIECRRLGRNGLGVELSEEVGARAAELIQQQHCEHGARTDLIVADSRSIDLRGPLASRGTDSVQLVIMHPPYHDIIRFTEDERDLSNAAGTDQFLEMFLAVLDNVTPVLAEGRYLAVVIGDKYSGGEWIPLGFMCMNQVLQRCYSLKSVIVKNFDETRAKREQKQLWRYRALAGGFYIFKHEYILVFRKR